MRLKMEIMYIFDVIMYDWGLIWDSIGRGWGRQAVSRGKAARDGVATGGVLVYEEGGGGYSLWPYLLRVIFNKYGFYIIDYYRL